MSEKQKETKKKEEAPNGPAPGITIDMGDIVNSFKEMKQELHNLNKGETLSSEQISALRKCAYSSGVGPEFDSAFGLKGKFNRVNNTWNKQIQVKHVAYGLGGLVIVFAAYEAGSKLIGYPSIIWGSRSDLD